MKKLFIVAAVACSTMALGCAPTEVDEFGASFQALLGNDFTGNYLKVHGVRSVPADGKYPCLNEFEVCLGLDPEGATAAVKDLCPSDDYPEGTWSMTYVIYADAACDTPLTNLGCIPYFNEWLHPGVNHNDVICITRNAEKDFDVCVMDPVTGAGSEACPPCIPNGGPSLIPGCNPL